jgi:UDP-N-acetyl-D-glucosamine dehydrogenase
MNTFDVTVVGLGFTGLSMAVAVAEAGLRVVGLDSSARRVRDIADAVPGCGLATVPEDALRDVLVRGLLHVQGIAGSLPRTHTYLLCVPTPAGTDGGADLKPLLAAVDMVAGRLRRGDLVLVQSTCPPGTVERILMPRLAGRSGLDPGSAFRLAYSPVRIDPGTGPDDLRTLPRIVAGVTSGCAEAAMRFLARFTDQLVPVGTVRAAELIKVFENTFRLVNISLVNELAAVCRAYDIDANEVLDAAGTKPFGFLRHRPSPGAGGDCVPASAGFFAAAARRSGLVVPVVDAAITLNEAMPTHIVHLVEQLLLRNCLPPLQRCRVLVVGVTYKPDVANTRLSAAVRILEQLRWEVDISYHDPYVPSLVLRDGTTLHSRPIEPGCADLVLVLTRHSAINDAVLACTEVPVVDCADGTPRLLPLDAPAHMATAG